MLLSLLIACSSPAGRLYDTAEAVSDDTAGIADTASDAPVELDCWNAGGALWGGYVLDDLRNYGGPQGHLLEDGGWVEADAWIEGDGWDCWLDAVVTIYDDEQDNDFSSFSLDANECRAWLHSDIMDEPLTTGGCG